MAEEKTGNETMIDITLDDGVKKFIVGEGTGDVPVLHSRVRVRYTAQVNLNLGGGAPLWKVFDQTRFGGEQEIDSQPEADVKSQNQWKPTPGMSAAELTKLKTARMVHEEEQDEAGYEFCLQEDEGGYRNVPEGVRIAVATMKAGERVRLHLAAEYAFGEEGRSATQGGVVVPPATPVVYHLQLMGWEEKDDKELWEMEDDEKLEVSNSWRRRGNELYKAGEYGGAVRLYKRARRYLDDIIVLSDDEEEYMSEEEKNALKMEEDALGGPEGEVNGEQLKQAQLAVNCNLAQARLKLGQYLFCKLECDQVLEDEPQHSKAFFIRGQANLKWGDHGEALRDLRRAAELAPKDRSIRTALAEAQQHIQNHRSKEKQKFGGMFRDGSPTDSIEHDVRKGGQSTGVSGSESRALTASKTAKETTPIDDQSCPRSVLPSPDLSDSGLWIYDQD